MKTNPNLFILLLFPYYIHEDSELNSEFVIQQAS